MEEKIINMENCFSLQPFFVNGVKRRIRRFLRWQYIFSMFLSLIPLAGFISGFLIISTHQSESLESGLFMSALFGVVLNILWIWSTLGRLRDLNASPLWLILIFIPYVNIIFFIVLMFINGSDAPNKYGNPPLTAKRIKEFRQNGFTILDYKGKPLIFRK